MGNKFILISIIFFFSLIFVFQVFAISPGQIFSGSDVNVDAPRIEEAETLVDRVRAIVKIVYYLFFIIAVLFIILAAYNYLTAQGDAEKVKTSHQQVIYAIVAIVVALMAVGADTIISNFLTSGYTGSGGDGGAQYYSESGFNVRWQPLK